MTENEALKIGKALYENITLKGNNVIPVAKYIEFVGIAIQALAEIQQYRAIGTVEQLRTMFDGFWKLKDLCEEYEKYGLPEDYWKLNEMCKEYSAIGTIEEFKALKEKSVAKKMKINKKKGYEDYTECPVCKNTRICSMHKYCYKCGSKLDWQ